MATPYPNAWERHGTVELVREVASKATLLVGKEVELARVELKNNFASEVAMVKSVAVAAVASIVSLNMLLVAAVFALAPRLEPWLAAFVLAGVALVVGLITGLAGWRHHVARPLALTRRTLEEDVRWARGQLA